MAYLSLSTANLPNPAIDPAQGSSPEDYFGTVLYTAATTNGTYTHGDLSFRPDFTWIKNRNNVERHFLADVLRGNTSMTDKFLVSNDTAAEGTNGQSVTSFSVTDTGYEFVENSITSGELYFSGRTYVGWNWKANGSGVSNTDGTITSTVSANTTSGFSIVSYVSNGTNTGSVGHGLDQKPDIVIQKNRDTASDWLVLTDLIDGSDDYLLLNSTAAAATAAGGANATTFVSWDRPSGDNMICYAFHSVDGFSKIGKYVGNGSTDGPFVYTGFRPAFLLVKVTNTASSWLMFDTKRDIANVVNDTELAPNSSGAEGADAGDVSHDILSNGFKWRATGGDVNGSGNTYIYMAFAENPFKYSNAR